MTAKRRLANKRQRVAFLSARPADPNAVTVAEANAGVRMEFDLLPASRISPTGSTTINEGSIGEGTSAAVPDERQFEGTLTLFRSFEEDGTPDDGHESWEAVKGFRTPGWFLWSKGVDSEEDFAAGEEYSLYHAFTDEPQESTEAGGSIKAVVPLFVQNGWTNRTLVDGGGGGA